MLQNYALSYPFGSHEGEYTTAGMCDLCTVAKDQDPKNSKVRKMISVLLKGDHLVELISRQTYRSLM